MNDQRRGRVERETTETRIRLELALDGAGKAEIRTGVGFFDHMLTAFARHGLFDLELSCDGDLEVDAHHTVEDVGICLGQAIAEGLGDKRGIARFGHSYVSMDEALARAVVDLSGRSFLVFEAEFRDVQVGAFPVTLAEEFFRAVADHGKLNLHLDLLRGRNDHHGIEAMFKAFARALDQASRADGRVDGVPSTKGSL